MILKAIRITLTTVTFRGANEKETSLPFANVLRKLVSDGTDYVVLLLINITK